MSTAPYPSTNTTEQRSIVTIQGLVDLSRIKVHGLSVLDKVPNHDGSIWITNESQVEQAEMRVQIKTLSGTQSKTLKYSCKTSFLDYCQQCILPVLLLLVDNNQNKFYWVHYPISEARQLLNTIERKSFTIALDAQKCIDGSNHRYVQDWVKIYQDHKLKLINYDFIKDVSTLREQQLEQLQSRVNVSAGHSKPEYGEIQKFLDIYNDLLNRDFSLVKQTFFPNCWKIGIGIIEYGEKELSHYLYPIDYSHNEVLIKETILQDYDKTGLSTVKHLLSENPSLSYVHHLLRNPIKTLPNAYAHYIIKKQVFETIGKVELPVENPFLAIEYVYAFVTEYYSILGLGLKTEYSLFEVFHGVYIIVPHLLNKVHYNEADQQITTVDLDVLKQETKRLKVKVKLKSGEQYLRHQFKLISGKMNVNLVQFYLEYLREIGVQNIHRQITGYNKTFTKPKLDSRVMGSQFSEAFHKYFIEVPGIYGAIIRQYFPYLTQELSFFKEFDILVVELEVYEAGRVFMNYAELAHDGPPQDKRVIVSDYDDPNSIMKTLWGPGTLIPNGPPSIQIEGKKFRLKSIGRSPMDFTAFKTPLAAYCTNLLREKLTSYFEEKLKDYNRQRFTL